MYIVNGIVLAATAVVLLKAGVSFGALFALLTLETGVLTLLWSPHVRQVVGAYLGRPHAEVLMGHACARELHLEAALHWYRKAAAHGDTEACLKVAEAYDEGRGVGKDDEAATFWYRQAAERGESGAMLPLAQAYREGRGVAKDDVQAAHWYGKAAAQGLPDGCVLLARAYAVGRGVAQDDVQSVAWLTRAFDESVPSSRDYVFLALMYLTGRGVARDAHKALTLLQTAARKDAFLGLSMSGDVAFGDEQLAEWIERIEAEDPQAEATLGTLFWRSVDDARHALMWWSKSAAKQCAEGQVRLGVAYANGTGIARDDAAAVYWFQKSADQEHAYAQQCLAEAYFSGRGIARDDGRGLAWCQRSAAFGNRKCQAVLGEAYAEAGGALKDEAVARVWHYRAARWAQGGDNPRPDQGIVDEIGRAIGVEYEDNEQLKGEEKLSERDRGPWELYPFSDYLAAAVKNGDISDLIDLDKRYRAQDEAAIELYWQFIGGGEAGQKADAPGGGEAPQYITADGAAARRPDEM